MDPPSPRLSAGQDEAGLPMRAGAPRGTGLRAIDLARQKALIAGPSEHGGRVLPAITADLRDFVASLRADLFAACQRRR